MERFLPASLAAVLLALLLPALWPNEPSVSPPIAAGSKDAECTFTVQTDSGIEQHTMADYLPGVLAGEMPALFQPEALKAQAVAARTYILYRMNHRPEAHPDADICNDPACCKAYHTESELRELWGGQYDAYHEKMTAAVRDTDGQFLQYGGAAIQAVFHAASAGVTQASGEIWNDCPYLKSVASPETAADVPNYVTEVEVSPEEFRTALETVQPTISFSDSPADWLGDSPQNASGRVEFTSVCGTNIPGTEMRSRFHLRSTAYTLAYTDRGSFLFTVTGYGHGVGMSQYGANVYAKNGWSYDAILAHYYPGTELVSG